MTKSNFSFLKDEFSILYNLGQSAESNVYIEYLFSKADKIEGQYKILKEKIDHLPQAILAKAFRGELVEQLESDGDARELLKKIEGLKKDAGGKKK